MATTLDQLRELAAPALVSALSRQTGESEPAISKGLSAATLAIASTIGARADDTGFMRNVADLAARVGTAPHPLRTLDNLTSSPAGIDQNRLTGRWLSGLFGSNLSDVTDSVARYAGIRGPSAGSLLSIAAPLVLGFIGRLMKHESLSVAGLSDWFRSRRGTFDAAMPPGFHLPESVATPSAAAHGVHERSSTGWSGPLLALLAAIGIGGLLWWGSDTPRQVAHVNVVEPVEKPIGTTGAVAGKFARTLPGNVILVIPTRGSAEDRLSMYLSAAHAGTTTVNFDRVTFDTGSAALTGASNEQIDNIAKILHAYPKTNVTIVGHTDSVGREGANMSLSKARANAVAARLNTDLVASDRVRTKGNGSRSPIADNATESGRAQNRRVELQVEVR
jgi:outer membrane protein OmpA-like peptidoglycan-associated protein